MRSVTGATSLRRCAYCQEPFCFAGNTMRALPVGSQFVCNEFCAQALREEAQVVVPRTS
jgi:hypothetical protein